MSNYITGTTIKKLREKQKMTQLELADIIGVSDKTVSKWETGKGLPDISLIEPLANALNISIIELISEEYVTNANKSSNMRRSKVYVCPICGNIINAMGEAVISCCGITLSALEAETPDENHIILIKKAEDEFYIRISHEMTKSHYISFIAAVSGDRLQLVKLYPEGVAEARFKISMVKKILFYCNKDGLFSADIIKGVHDREVCYGD